MFAQQAAEHFGNFHYHDTRLIGIGANERGNRVERVEQEVRIDLAGERREARFHQQARLFFELLFVARVVPDFQRDGDGEERGGVDGGDGQPVARVDGRRWFEAEEEAAVGRISPE